MLYKIKVFLALTIFSFYGSCNSIGLALMRYFESNPAIMNRLSLIDTALSTTGRATVSGVGITVDLVKRALRASREPIGNFLAASSNDILQGNFNALGQRILPTNYRPSTDTIRNLALLSSPAICSQLYLNNLILSYLIMSPIYMQALFNIVAQATRQGVIRAAHVDVDALERELAGGGVAPNGEIERIIQALSGFANRRIVQTANYIRQQFNNHGDVRLAIEEATAMIIAQFREFGNLFIHEQYKAVAIITVAMFGSIFALHKATKIATNIIERKLVTPSLILESNISSTFEKAKNVFASNKVDLNDMVFNEETEAKLKKFMLTTNNITKLLKKGKKNICYRNLILTGHPGTGKTMYARELAKRTGMKYVLFTGASFSKFKDGDGINSMDELFSWAKRHSKDGLMIIIDEADSLLSDRTKMAPNSLPYLLVNNFLHHVGEGSNKFLVVMCTNHIEKFDKAVLNRADIIDVPLPEYIERIRVLDLYKNKILLDVKQNGKKFVESVNEFLTEEKIIEIAKITDKVSNRELKNIINTIKITADITDDGLVNSEIIDIAVKEAVDKIQKVY